MKLQRARGLSTLNRQDVKLQRAGGLSTLNRQDVKETAVYSSEILSQHLNKGAAKKRQKTRVRTAGVWAEIRRPNLANTKDSVMSIHVIKNYFCMIRFNSIISVKK
jgi:hypothetical protein